MLARPNLNKQKTLFHARQVRNSSQSSTIWNSLKFSKMREILITDTVSICLCALKIAKTPQFSMAYKSILMVLKGANGTCI